MSTRIHELAKLYNMEGKDLLTLLKERGYVAADTKSVSSTVSKIYLDEIEKELGVRKTPAAQEKAPEAEHRHEHAPHSHAPITEPPDETAPA